MKKIPAEKLNMVLALHYLHGLSRKQITRISGLHYTQVDSHIAKLDKQLASGELSRDDIMASAESANKRLGLEELVAKDGGKELEEATSKRLSEAVAKAVASGGIIGKNINPSYPFKDPKELRIDLPEDFAKKHVSDTRCAQHYAIYVLESLIQRIKNRSIVVTCLSISEEDFSTLSINWRSKNETK